MKKNYLIGYDISDGKRLGRVARIMKEYGYRLQYSFFHCCISEIQKKRLMNRVRKVIHENEDQVIILPVQESQLKNLEFIGVKTQIEIEGVIIF
ncbi:MAG: CRISPR-associated endonuclease Cas2 [Deltaproteobacteria bacterium]|nr:CRISPR-associated endonuclease Cas2 [Deltaproteobacteria bacterium]